MERPVASSPWHVERALVTTPDGWTLPLARGVRPARPPGRPVLFVPGYGMNAHIFRFHPTRGSFFEAMLDAGLDPWAVDLRGSSSSRGPRRGAPVRLADMAFVDLPTAIDAVRSATGHERVHAVGCSLGGSLLYGWAAAGDRHRIDRLVAMGSPLRWEKTALVRAFVATSAVSGAFPVRGTRAFARAALPFAARFASPALRIYLNPKITSVHAVDELTRTVEDPIPAVNREMASWMRNGSLILDGVDVARGLARFDRPVLIVTADGDGICDRGSALSAAGIPRGIVRTLEVSHPSGERVGHADLFICDVAPERVYAPIAGFLNES